MISFLVEEFDGLSLLLYLHKVFWDVVPFLCLHEFKDAALVNPDLISAEFMILPKVFPGVVHGLTVVGINLFHFNDVVVDNHNEKSVIVAPVLCSIRIEGGIWEINVAINVGLGIQDLEDPTHHAAPVGPITFFFVQGLDGGREDR